MCDVCRWVRSNLTRPRTTRTRNKPRAGRQSRAVRLCRYITLLLLLPLLLLFIVEDVLYGQKHRSSNIALQRSRSRHNAPSTSPHYNPHAQASCIIFTCRRACMCVLFCSRGSRPQNVYAHRCTMYACILSMRIHR